MQIEELISEWRNNVEAYAKAKANSDYLKEFRKSKKAMLVVEAEQKGRKTALERESYAYTHKEYIALLEALRIATEEAESLRYRMMIAQERVNIWRTKQANNRKELDSYGG